MTAQCRNVSQEKDIDILAVNGIDIDWLLEMPKLPSYDEKLTAEYLGKHAGGPVGNFACLASAFGVKVAAACTLGEDEGGKIINDDFQKFGVDTRYVIHDRSFITPFVIVIVDPVGEKAVIIPHLEGNHLAQISEEALRRSNYVYLLAADHQATLAAAKRAKANHAQVMMDIEPSEGLSSDLLMTMLQYCDIASFNEQGFTSRFGDPSSTEAPQKLLFLGPSLIIITRGRKGSMAINSAGKVDVPGYSVPVKDTTGAGDTFNAAFMSRYILGERVEDCLRFGNAAAALLIQTVGTRTHIPTVNEINNFINQQKKIKNGVFNE